MRDFLLEVKSPRKKVKQVLVVLCAMWIGIIYCALNYHGTIFKSCDMPKYIEKLPITQVTAESKIKGDAWAITSLTCDYLKVNCPQMYHFKTTLAPPSCTVYLCLNGVSPQEYTAEKWNYAWQVRELRDYLAGLCEKDGYKVAVYLMRYETIDPYEGLVFARPDRHLGRAVYDW